ncbi:MAG: hypothetical protein Fur0020_01610 [Thermodesulfovibrionia bacterium]
MVGSTSLPFHIVVIKPVINKTYEPGLEDVMHRAISREFISQGISVTSSETTENLPRIETVIRLFQTNTIAVSDNKVAEESIVMSVDFRFIDDKRVMEFRSVTSPINITFQTAGGITDAIVEKQKAIEKASTEIAKELISRLAMRYGR